MDNKEIGLLETHIIFFNHGNLIGKDRLSGGRDYYSTFCKYFMVLRQLSSAINSRIDYTAKQGRGKHLKFGGTKLRGYFLLKKKGEFSKNEKGTFLSIAKSWRHVPPVRPLPTWLRHDFCWENEKIME